MSRSSRFTAVSGTGALGAGIVAVASGWVSAHEPGTTGWMATWMLAAAVATVIALAATARKVRRSGGETASMPARRFVSAMAPPILAAAVLTPALLVAGQQRLLPPMWLLLYGTGIVVGGAHAVPLISIMGATFMAAGAVALLVPPGFEDLIMVLGFGGLHLVFGAGIARWHGG